MRSNQKKWIALAAVIVTVGALLFFWKKPSLREGDSPGSAPTAALPPTDLQEDLAAAPNSPDPADSESAQTTEQPSSTAMPSESNPGVTTGELATRPTPENPSTPDGKLIQTPGSPALSGPQAQAPGVTAAVPSAPADGCYTLAFKHQDLPGHQSGEACTQHKNLLALPSQKLSAKSLCVRVNGTPVKFAFDSKKNQVLLSSIAGPRSEITVRYCTGGATCAEDCTVPRDEFMEALGAVDQSGSQPTVAWDIRNSGKGPTKEEAALDKELVELKRELASVDRNSEEIFKGWVAGKEKAATCKAAPGKVAKL